jgi:AraC family transcriptional regulator of adaptative response / DNA-3-methyladenine glycosylase II
MRNRRVDVIRRRLDVARTCELPCARPLAVMPHLLADHDHDGRDVGPDVAAAANGELSLLLPYQAPYDWPAMLEFLRPRAIPGIERVEDGCYARTIELDRVQGIVSIRPADGHALQATIRIPKLSTLPVIIARLRRVFDLAADPLPISTHLATDPVLAPLVAKRPGLRVPGAWEGFELALRAVLGQQITVAGAVRLAGRLVAVHGEPMTAPDRDLTHVFPRPDALAGADLTALGMPRSRAATLSAVAVAVLADSDLFEAHHGLDEALQRLRSIRGVGEWTAQYIALRALREPDAFPASDIGLVRALTVDGGRRPTAEEVLARAETWRPWRGYAAQHLWAAALPRVIGARRARHALSEAGRPA